MPLSAGDKLGPYEILASVGAGGMGHVYRARDARLDRDVAIKVSAVQFSERFESEAKAIAALSHPNICQIYDVGPDYLVMEYVDGLPIIDGEQPQPLPPDEALRLARQIAAALEAAARQRGHSSRSQTGEHSLDLGRRCKTPGFRARETEHWQPDRGRNPNHGHPGGHDHGHSGLHVAGAGRRKDGRRALRYFLVWSVLYEMLAGRRAFTGGSSAATIGAIVHKNPEPLDAPPALEAIVRKCMSKSPEGRFQTATDLRRALEAASIRGISGSKRRTIALTIAVLDHLTEVSAHSWVAPYNVAVIYAGLGEKDQAFALLDQAYKDRSYYLSTYLATDARMDSLRSDPRFGELQRRVGLPQ